MAAPEPSNEEPSNEEPSNEEPSNNPITSIPVVDLRLLTQSELHALSLADAPQDRRRAIDDPIIPTINRAFFNESAGSRRQTYSRLRLVPRNSDNAPASSSSPNIPPPVPEPVDEDNSRIIAVLQELMDVEPLHNAQHPNDTPSLAPVQTDFTLPEFAAVAPTNVPIDVGDSSQRKRKRGRPRRNENLEEEPSKATVNVQEKRSDVDAVRESEVKAAETVDEKPPVTAVEEAVDPFADELKRRIQGMETESQLLEFLETLDGEWGSQRKKRRFIQASALGHLLPTGWKIVLNVQRRAGRVTIICRRYVSPDGHQFDSYKEASTHLLSSSGVQDRPEGSQQFSSSINLASENNVGQVPTGVMMTNTANSSSVLDSTSIHSHLAKQATMCSSLGNEKLNSSDGNINSDLALGCKSGDTSGGAFRDPDHQIEDKQLLKADKNDADSVQGCSLAEDKVCRVRNEKFVGATEASDAACNQYIPLVSTTPFSDNNSVTDQFSNETNAGTCIQGGTSNFASQDTNPGSYETVPCGNEQAHVDNNKLGLSVELVEEHTQKIGSESMLAPNYEGKICSSNNLEDRLLISSLEDAEMGDGKPIKDEKLQNVCSRYQPENRDISANVNLQNSAEGCSLVPTHNELQHTSINCPTDRTQTSMLKDSAEENFFDDFPISSLDERTCLHSGYINNVSFNSCMQDASDFGGIDFAPNLEVAKDVSHYHVPPNEEVVTSCLLERNSLNEQNCAMDNLLHRNSGNNLFALTGNQHPPAFLDNENNISADTFDALKAVDAGFMKPQLGIVSGSNVASVDTHTTTNFMQGRSQGFVSVPLGGSILNQFDKQSDDGVSKAHKSCSSEKAKSDAEIFQTDSMGLPKFQ